MAVTYQQIERQVSNLLGHVKGADLTATEASYVAASSAVNRLNPDFPASAIADAIVTALDEIVQAITETPRHPERQGFISMSVNLSSGEQLPRTDSGAANKLIGVMGRVYDAGDGVSCLPMSLDTIRSYNRHKGTIYADFNPYWWALDGQAIEHTRSEVIAEVCTWARPTLAAPSPIPVDDYHEWPLVCGAIVRLAPREALYMDLLTYCGRLWAEHIAGIRGMVDPVRATDAIGAPATT